MHWLGYVVVRIRDWGMTANRTEMVQAVHVLQAFAVQHMLARIEPELWASWTEHPTGDPKTSREKPFLNAPPFQCQERTRLDLPEPPMAEPGPQPGLPWRTFDGCAWESYEGLDAGIRFAVRVLHAAGIQTGQSCEGGEGHAYPEPTIDLDRDGTNAGFAAWAALREYGLPVATIGRTWQDQSGELVGPFWRIVFRAPMHDRATDTPIFEHGYRVPSLATD
jgi:hypothetical protein